MYNFKKNLRSKLIYFILTCFLLLTIYNTLLPKQNAIQHQSNFQQVAKQDTHINEQAIKLTSPSKSQNSNNQSNTQQAGNTPNHKVAKSSQHQQVKLVRVIDGDTIVVQINGIQEKVRYIGIDTPEIHPKECGALQAKQANEQLLKNAEKIILEKDVGERDKYGRLLRYVYVIKNKKKIFVNAKLVEQGLATVLTIPPDVKYSQLFIKLQKQARQKHIGIWGDLCNNSKTSNTFNNNQLTNALNSSYNCAQVYCKANIYNCSDFNLP